MTIHMTNSKLTTHRLILLLAISVSTLVAHAAKDLKYTFKQPITIGLDANYAPLQSVGRDGKPRGYDVDFTHELMSRLGLEFYYVPALWGKVASDVLNGETDLAMMVYSPYRKDSIHYSHPIFRLYYQVVYRKSDYKKFDFRNLKGKTLAFLNSRPITELIKREGGKSVRVYDLNEAFQNLAIGKYDAIICYSYQAKYFIQHYHLNQLQAEEISMQPREYCYVSHNKELIDAIDQELDRMEAAGIIDSIYGDNFKHSIETRVPQWMWYLLFTVGTLFLILYTGMMYRSRRKLKLANAMLETNYKILEMSHEELLETNHQLIAASEKAEESAKMKQNFIKQISHEIRTPLNILSGFTQVITTPDMDLSNEEKKQIGHNIIENTNRITRLVNRMLELSEAGSRSVIERNDETTAADIARSAVSTSCISDAQGLSFNMAITPKAETIRIKTNIESAVSALSCLLDNAQKYTTKSSERRASLNVRVTPENIEFAVEDTGIGVPAEEAEHIFEEFVQLDDYYDGTGIGLSVARSLARRMGGDVVLDTTYSPGARFILTLPR